MSTKLASKDIGRRKSEFVAMTQFLYIHFCQLYWYEYGTTCLNTKIDIYVGCFYYRNLQKCPIYQIQNENRLLISMFIEEID